MKLKPGEQQDLGSKHWNIGKGEKDKQEVKKKKVEVREGILKTTTADTD